LNGSETWEIIIGVCVLIAVYILTRRYHAWRMARAYNVILKDLEQKEAVDPSSAVGLPYSRQNLFRMGTRDYLPKMLQQMTAHGMVSVTADGRYYVSHAKADRPRP
jgi:hypothetical protein